MHQHDIQFTFKARFYTLGKLTSNTKQIWFVLHGYGQLAGYFIRKFSALEEQNILWHEGLSILPRKQSMVMKVGATWMTKTLADIENYLQTSILYLKIRLDHLITRHHR
jgi:hypothetical protein